MEQELYFGSTTITGIWNPQSINLSWSRLRGNIIMDGNELISVVIPTYNRPNCLERALDSVCAQTYDNIEIIVVDDHSETPVNCIIKDYQQMTVEVIRHNNNLGANAARNTGIRNANGDFIAFLDDDDKWDEEKLQKQIEVIKKNDVDVVYTGIRYLNSNGEVLNKTIPGKVPNNTTTELFKRNFIGSFSVILVSAKIIKEVGLPDEELPIWQDKEWYVRLSQHTKFVPIKEILVSRYVDRHDRITGDFEGLINTTLPIFINKYDEVVENGTTFERRQIHSQIYGKVASYALRTMNYNSGRKFALKSLRHYPFNFKSIIYLMFCIGGDHTRLIYNKLR